MALTKAEIADHLCETVKISKGDAKHFVDTFFEVIRATLESGEEVKLSGFGNFELKNKAERPGRNPKTGIDVPISARRVVTFKTGQKLKARVDDNVAALKEKLLD